MAATTDHARDLAEATAALLDLIREIASTGNAALDDVKVRRATAIELLESEAAIRARRALARFEWEGRWRSENEESRAAVQTPPGWHQEMEAP